MQHSLERVWPQAVQFSAAEICSRASGCLKIAFSAFGLYLQQVLWIHAMYTRPYKSLVKPTQFAQQLWLEVQFVWHFRGIAILQDLFDFRRSQNGKLNRTVMGTSNLVSFVYFMVSLISVITTPHLYTPSSTHWIHYCFWFTLMVGKMGWFQRLVLSLPQYDSSYLTHLGRWRLHQVLSL